MTALQEPRGKKTFIGLRLAFLDKSGKVAEKIGEQIGVPAYAKIIDRQSQDVQQRIRDFLFYPIARHAPKNQWEAALEENRRMYFGLFPKGFQFGHADPIFADEI